MNLEINLVKINGIHDKVATLLSRTRVNVAGDSEVMKALTDFIASNINVFDSAISDRGFVSNLEGLDNLTNEQLYGIKYAMAQSGIDLIFYAVSDNEDNPSEIPDGLMEYIAINNIHATSTITKFATKFIISESDIRVSQIYKTMNELYGNFDSDALIGRVNPISEQLDYLSQDENYVGVTPLSITNYLNSVFDYLGKELIVITN